MAVPTLLFHTRHPAFFDAFLPYEALAHLVGLHLNTHPASIAHDRDLESINQVWIPAKYTNEMARIIKAVIKRGGT